MSLSGPQCLSRAGLRVTPSLSSVRRSLLSRGPLSRLALTLPTSAAPNSIARISAAMVRAGRMADVGLSCPSFRTAIRLGPLKARGFGTLNKSITSSPFCCSFDRQPRHTITGIISGAILACPQHAQCQGWTAYWLQYVLYSIRLFVPPPVCPRAIAIPVSRATDPRLGARGQLGSARCLSDRFGYLPTDGLPRWTFCYRRRKEAGVDLQMRGGWTADCEDCPRFLRLPQESKRETDS
ncbi:unnamed protein product [Mycena citricolor]|uniref:Uncharacterized protein n=1 Tax=Mycena citricolor TaxID=2018698 RepID=A0AAD2H0E3_9AGAR|nr:unnamed protein product [Mycena citricolor]